MAEANTSTNIIVLRHTKLGEMDLIITGFSEQGHQIRAVAKSGRKPGSKLGVHLQLFSISHVLVSNRRNLGIITEAQMRCSNEGCRSDVLHTAGAAAIVELLDKISSDSDGDPRLYALACEALRVMGEVPESHVRLIAAAALIKMASVSGVRPQLKNCVCCGNALVNDAGVGKVSAGAAAAAPVASVAFSQGEGGVVCEFCASELEPYSYTGIAPQLIEWLELLIGSRFVDLAALEDLPHDELGQLLLDFIRKWIGQHLISRLKSLDFLISFSA